MIARSNKLFVAILFGCAVSQAIGGAGLVPCIACMAELCPAVLVACQALGFTPLVCACIGVGCGATCTTACAFIAAGCFEEATVVVTPGGNKRIAEVIEGDLVLGLGDKFTKVTHVQEYVGDFDMVTMGFADPIASLTATGSHWHFAKTPDAGLTPIQGANVTLGTEMLRNPPMGNSRIVSLAASKAPKKFSITTESCSVYANGILTGTTCANATAMLYRHQLWVQYAEYLKGSDLDVNQDGKINMDEMEAHVSNTAWAHHQNTTKMHGRRVGLDRADNSGDGQPDFEEFADYVRGIHFAFQNEFIAAHKEQHKKDASHIINQFDLDNDQSLTDAEIQRALEQLLVL